jgi:hypothetical protein
VKKLHENCTVPGCGLPHKSRGFCATHYAQARRNISPVGPIKSRDSTPPERCTEESCSEPTKAKGLCKMHYARLLRHGHTRYRDRTKPARPCGVDGCSMVYYANGVCHAHYQHRKTMEQYGITVERYTEMLAQQNGRCAICDGIETMLDARTQRPRMLAVDHSHVTTVVRGLLCARCNRGIGFFEDRPELLTKAADYLISHQPSKPADTDSHESPTDS